MEREKTDSLPDMLTVQEVADHIGWHPNTVYKRCTSGEIPSFKSKNTRRIRKEDYLEWMVQMKTVVIN